MRLDEFSSELERLMHGRDLRPFVCEGSPLKSRIFIVGYNPATAFQNAFYSHWNKDSGFLRKEFLEDFRRQRNQLEKLRGTRARLETIVDHFKAHFGRNVICETNVYSEPTPKAKQLKIFDTKVFEFLIESIQPQIVLVHGNKAFKVFRRLFSGDIERSDIPQEITLHGQCVRFFWSKHLSLIETARAKEIGSVLAASLKNKTKGLE